MIIRNDAEPETRFEVPGSAWRRKEFIKSDYPSAIFSVGPVSEGRVSPTGGGGKSLVIGPSTGPK
jgi:hypothetical protein